MFSSSNKLRYINFAELLKEFDQEHLFKKYTNLNPNGFNYSIFRKDKSPDCRFKWYKGLLYYVDNATFKGKLYFDILDVLSELYNISKLEAAHKIIAENNSSINKKNYYMDQAVVNRVNIRFEKQEWEKDNYLLLDPNTLENEYVFKVKNYWIDSGEGFKKNHVYNPSNILTIAYYFPKTDSVKLYWPNQQFKFYTNATPNDIFISDDFLPFDNTFIITKSNKDRLLFKHMYGFESVAPQSENQPIKQEVIDLAKQYKKQYTIYDADHTGIVFAKKILEEHGIDYTFINLDKDLYAATIRYGKENVQLYLDSKIKNKQ